MSFAKWIPLLLLILAGADAGAAPKYAGAVIGRLQSSSGKVRIMRGNTGRIPVPKEELRWGDELRGEAGALAEVWLPRQEFKLHGPFRVVLEKSSSILDVSIIQIYEGHLRMRTRNIVSNGRAVPVVRTESGTVTVRDNADFYANYEPLFDETEVITFSEKPELTAARNTTSRAVGGGEWAGVGGRYGSTVRPPLLLRPELVSHFRSLLPLQ